MGSCMSRVGSTHSKNYVILGGGFYGLYSALFLAERGIQVTLIERDAVFFSRASYINQARIHLGYHYPRSLDTALKTAAYFHRFVKDYGFCIKDDFRKVYAISRQFSFTNTKQFCAFCEAAGIPYEAIAVDELFDPQYVEGAFETHEYTYDAALLCKRLLESLRDYSDSVRLLTGRHVTTVVRDGGQFELTLDDGERITTPWVLNATYASINQINQLFGAPLARIKYEICEVALCLAGNALKGVGITVMDGPFFSLMPFGQTGFHSLTNVSFTPHRTSYDALPRFGCQDRTADCSPEQLGNCNTCTMRPVSAWRYMVQQVRKYLAPALNFKYERSLFAIKPILASSELDDSRPTVINCVGDAPPIYRSVLSGKINTVFDLNGELLHDISQ